MPGLARPAAALASTASPRPAPHAARIDASALQESQAPLARGCLLLQACQRKHWPEHKLDCASKPGGWEYGLPMERPAVRMSAPFTREAFEVQALPGCVKMVQAGHVGLTAGGGLSPWA